MHEETIRIPTEQQHQFELLLLSRLISCETVKDSEWIVYQFHSEFEYNEALVIYNSLT